MWCLRASHCVPEAVKTSVYDNNCSLAQTHTSCTVWPFAPETSGTEPFPAPVGLGPALRPLVSSPRPQSNSLTLTHMFLHSVCLSVLSFRGGTRGGVAYRGGSRTDGGQFAGPQRWRGDRHPSSFFTPRIDKHKSCLQMKGNSCSNWCFFFMCDRLTGGGQQGLPVHTDPSSGGRRRTTHGVVPADAAPAEPATCSWCPGHIQSSWQGPHRHIKKN